MDVQIQNHRVWQRPLVPNKEHFQVLHHDESFGAEYDFFNQSDMHDLIQGLRVSAMEFCLYDIFTVPDA